MRWGTAGGPARGGAGSEPLEPPPAPWAALLLPPEDGHTDERRGRATPGVVELAPSGGAGHSPRGPGPTMAELAPMERDCANLGITVKNAEDVSTSLTGYLPEL